MIEKQDTAWYYRKQPEEDRECYHCGEKGHLRKNCEQLKKERGGAGKGTKPMISFAAAYRGRACMAVMGCLPVMVLVVVCVHVSTIYAHEFAWLVA
jgi:hypothetical protein